MVGLTFHNVEEGFTYCELLTFKICGIPELGGGESHPWGALAGQGEQRARSEEQERGRERFNGRSGNARGAARAVVPPLTAADEEEEEEKLLAAPAASTGARPSSHRAPPAPIGGSPAPPGATPVGHQLPD